LFLSRDDASAYVRGVRDFEFDANLGAYPLDGGLKKWIGLSCFLSPSLVSRLQPIGAQIMATGKALTTEERRQIEEAMEEMGVAEERREEELGSEALRPETQCYYTAIPSPQTSLSKPYTPAQLTALHMDKSAILERMIAEAYEGNETLLLGELQYSFICFLLGQSYEGFEQWKKLVTLALTCEGAVYDTERRGQLWSSLLSLLKLQLSEAPEEFFIDLVEGENFLHHSLCDFFEIVADERAGGDLQEQAEEFKAFVEDRFGIPFDFTTSQLEEDMPTIVEM